MPTNPGDVWIKGNVGIGTTNPQAKLQVVGLYSGIFGTDGLLKIKSLSGGSCPGCGTEAITLQTSIDSRTDDYTISSYGGDSRHVLSLQPQGGNVGIGTTSPTYQLQLSTDSAAKPGTNTWTIVSDARIKKDIHPYTNGLSIIKRINPVWFKYNGKAGFPNDNQEHIGVIAQEIVKVAPYTVNTFRGKLNPDDKKETDLLNFNSHALTFDLINAVKELDTNITKLTQENQDLKKDNKELKSEVENLKVRLSRLETRIK